MVSNELVGNIIRRVIHPKKFYGTASEFLKFLIYYFFLKKKRYYYCDERLIRVKP